MALFSTRLRKASYDGVSFEVSSADVSFGRRTVTHEYPQRDTPYTEDLGRSKRTFTLNGFIVGDDYLTRTKNLISKIETSGGTAKKLVHPWLGSLQVYAVDTPKVSWDVHRRLSTFTVSFVEAGSLENPTSGKSWGAMLRAEVDSWADSLADSLGLTWDQIEDFNDLVSDIATGQFQDILGCLSDCKFTKLFDLADNVSDLVTTAASALSSGASGFTSSLLNALGVGGFTSSVINWRSAAKACGEVINDKTVKADAASVSVWTSSSRDRASQKEQLATSVKDQVRAVMLVQMAGAASMIGSAYDGDSSDDAATAGQVRSEEEIITLRNDILALLETEMIYQGTDPTGQYEHLENVYHYIYRYLTDEVMDSSGTVTVMPHEPEPTLVLAYEEQGDSSTTDDIIRRNRIRFPLFMEQKPMVLSQS